MENYDMMVLGSAIGVESAPMALKALEVWRAAQTALVQSARRLL